MKIQKIENKILIIMGIVIIGLYSWMIIGSHNLQKNETKFICSYYSGCKPISEFHYSK